MPTDFDPASLREELAYHGWPPLLIKALTEPSRYKALLRTGGDTTFARAALCDDQFEWVSLLASSAETAQLLGAQLGAQLRVADITIMLERGTLLSAACAARNTPISPSPSAETMKDRVARVVWDGLPRDTGATAAEVLKAMREPTDATRLAALRYGHSPLDIDSVWRAMIDATLSE